MDTARANSIFADVALTDDGDVWWEGIDGEMPDHLIDWDGNDFTKADAEAGRFAAHPNSRFTVPASQCPIDLARLGGARGCSGSTRSCSAAAAPPTSRSVAEQYSADHGVFIGASVASEVTAAATDVKAGSLRHDPFAMLPSAATTWPNTGATGRRCRPSSATSSPRFTRSTGSVGTRTASSCGPASATTPAYSTGSSAAPTVALRPPTASPVATPSSRTSTLTAPMSTRRPGQALRDRPGCLGKRDRSGRRILQAVR